MRVPWQNEAAEGPPSAGETLRRYAWFVTLAVASGAGSGVVMIGCGGRLAMRLLAATAGDAAQGRVTEADEIVGRISADGTLGFVLFVGLLGGLVTGALYVLIARWLPRGPSGGLAYGALLLVVGASRIDPLRPENPDFDIVGPGWVAVAVFVALGLGHGMLVAAIAGRYSRVLPLWSNRPRTITPYAPLLILVPAFPLLVPVLAVAPLVLGLSRSQVIARFLASPRTLMAGRWAGVALALVAGPGFLTAVIDIAGRP